MSRFHQLVSSMLADQKIDDHDVQLVREALQQDDKLDLEDVKLLVELYCNALERSPAFDAMFFTVLEEVLLEDGEIQPSEQYYLLKLLYADRRISEPERNLLRRLHDRATLHTLQFDDLCTTALCAPEVDWCVGGR